MNSGSLIVVSFFVGATFSGFLIRQQSLHAGRRYGVALMIEGVLLTGAWLGLRANHVSGEVLAAMACGLQNALATSYSGAVLRTTHMTGVVTDLGIELGKLVYWNADPSLPMPVRADRDRLKVLGGLLAAFLVGGVSGAYGFKAFGYGFTIPIAVLLAVISLVPAWDDLR